MNDFEEHLFIKIINKSIQTKPKHLDIILGPWEN